MHISLIAAVADNGVIGHENRMIWHIPEDLKRFKRLTSGHAVIMGRKTYENLPIRPLPNRRNIIISRQTIEFQGAEVVHSAPEAIAICEEETEIFIAGGAEIYTLFLPFITKIYLTKVHKNFEGDTFLPKINFSKFKLIDSEFTRAEIHTTFQIYEKQ